MEREICVNKEFTRTFKLKTYEVLATYANRSQVYKIKTAEYYLSNADLKHCILQDCKDKILKIKILSVTNELVTKKFIAEF